jgi:hypothetical protein
MRFIKLSERHIEAVRRYKGAQMGIVQRKIMPIHKEPKK